MYCVVVAANTLYATADTHFRLPLSALHNSQAHSTPLHAQTVHVQQFSKSVALLGEPCLWLRLLAEMQVIRQG